MATPKKKKESQRIIWRKLPDGGHYADYKLGTIIRWKINKEVRYHIKVSYNKAYNASSLADAKRQIDAYTRIRIEQYERERKPQIKKR